MLIMSLCKSIRCEFQGTWLERHTGDGETMNDITSLSVARTCNTSLGFGLTWPRREHVVLGLLFSTHMPTRTNVNIHVRTHAHTPLLHA